MNTRIMYIEQKTPNEDGPARIGRVRFSKSGKTIHYQGQSFVRVKSGLGNYILDNRDPQRTGPDPWPAPEPEYYWISGPKKDGSDRLFGKLPVEIDEDVAEEYWSQIRKK